MIAYLDTSSLIKLYVEEAGSTEVRTLLGAAASVATSAMAYAEARATFARLRRARFLTPQAFATVKRLFEEDWTRFVSIDPTTALVAQAGDLAQRYDLRALDAIHLASFVQVLERATHDDVEFSSFDDRLNRAARRLK